MDSGRQEVCLRKFPYPYRACLSICSDIDYTDTRNKFEAIQSFMNKEVGIKFTNTFFPFHDKGDFSLFSGTPEDKEAILNYIRKGIIDAVHSYGEKQDFCRNDALRVLEELNKNNCRLPLWIDHAQSRSNFCKHRFFGRGDVRGEKEYHADLTLKHGIKFIWTERLTNIIGQERPLTLGDIWRIYDSRYPLLSLSHLAKTAAKIFLSFCGNKKYDYFKDNALVRTAVLQDGQKIYEFVRFNNSFRKPGQARRSSFTELRRIISPRVLEALKKSGGYSIVYVHLGKDFSLDTPEGKMASEALRNLKKEYTDSNIYIDSTARILNYYITHRYLDWDFEVKGDKCHIRIKSVDDPVFGHYAPDSEQLDEVTFYVPQGISVSVFNNDQEMVNIKHNPADYTGAKSVTIVKD